MPEITKDFWTDDNQAQERLNGCLVQYDEDFYYVDGIENGKAIVRNTENMGSFDGKKLKLSDPKFHKFRKLPPLGWRNLVLTNNRDKSLYTGAVYVKRTAARTRSHGLNRNNCTVYDFYNGSLTKSKAMQLEQAFGKGVKDNLKAPPTFERAHAALSKETSAALNPVWAMHRDEDGVTWLYRKLKRVALILTNTDISFLPAAEFYLEDAQQSGLFNNCNLKGL